MKKFSDTQPAQQPRETDRDPLKAGVPFILTGFIIQPSKKYPDGIAKLNGYDLITSKPVKFWYSGKAVIHQLQNMAKSIGMKEDGIILKEEIRCMADEVKGDKGRYLSLTDPK